MNTALKLIEDAYWRLPGLAPDILISGDARGVDEWGQVWWKTYLGDEDSIEHHPADWEKLGKRAGYIRNDIMVADADQAIIVWDGKSKGTRHTLDLLDGYRVPYVLQTIDTESGEVSTDRML